MTKADGPCVLILCLEAESTEAARVLTGAVRGTLFPHHHLAYYIRVKRDATGRLIYKGVRVKRPGSRVIVAAKKPTSAIGASA